MLTIYISSIISILGTGRKGRDMGCLQVNISDEVHDAMKVAMIQKKKPLYQVVEDACVSWLNDNEGKNSGHGPGRYQVSCPVKGVMPMGEYTGRSPDAAIRDAIENAVNTWVDSEAVELSEPDYDNAYAEKVGK